MSDIIVDGRTAVWFVPTIASSTGAPTVAEIAAGVRISPYMTPTGLQGFEASQADIDNSSFESTYDTKLPGRKSFSGTSVTLKEQTGDSAYTALVAAMAEATNGFIVIRDAILATASVAATTQKVDTHPVRCGLHQFMGRGEANGLLRRMISTPITGQVAQQVAILT